MVQRTNPVKKYPSFSATIFQIASLSAQSSTPRDIASKRHRPRAQHSNATRVKMTGLNVKLAGFVAFVVASGAAVHLLRGAVCLSLRDNTILMGAVAVHHVGILLLRDARFPQVH
jgi:hypothetical protein